jgi:fructosamine-3-kinase
MELPLWVRDHLEESLHATVTDVTLLQGGMVSHAARVGTTDDPVFVKWHTQAPAGMFACESDGLSEIGLATQSLRVPDVFTLLDAPEGSPPGLGFLAMEYIAPVSVQNSQKFCTRFAEGLAQLHKNTAMASKHRPYGWPSHGFIGTFRQYNQPRARDWWLFYRECRLLPQIELARTLGYLPPERENLLQTILDRLPELLNGLPAESCLIHGDLWSGNFLCAEGDTPVLIDPAAHHGHREMELAFMELFGGFPSGFMQAYHATYPLDAGYTYRRSLHQLYPLLVHLNYFGEKYGSRVEAVCREYVARL